MSSGLRRTPTLWLTAVLPVLLLILSRAALAEDVRTLQGHAKSVVSVEVSTDGRLIVSSSADRTVRLWNMDTGQNTRTIGGFKGIVNRAGFSPDGRFVAVADTWGYLVRLYETATGREVRVFRGHTYFVRSVAYAPDGRTIASVGDDSPVRLWDAATGRQIRLFKGHMDNTVAVTYSKDGRYLLSASEMEDKTVRLWDLASGREVRVFKGHVGSPRSVALSPDGRLALSAGADGTVRVWRVDTGQQTRMLLHIDVTDVAFSPDGRYIASVGALTRAAGGPDLRVLPGWQKGFPHGVILWDTYTGQPVKVLVGHTDTIYAVAFTPDGRLVVTGSGDKTIRLWRLD